MLGLGNTRSGNLRHFYVFLTPHCFSSTWWCNLLTNFIYVSRCLTTYDRTTDTNSILSQLFLCQILETIVAIKRLQENFICSCCSINICLWSIDNRVLRGELHLASCFLHLVHYVWLGLRVSSSTIEGERLCDSYWFYLLLLSCFGLQLLGFHHKGY